MAMPWRPTHDRPTLRRKGSTARMLARQTLNEPYWETNLVHGSPRITAPSRRWAALSLGTSFKIVQNDNCSSGSR